MINFYFDRNRKFVEQIKTKNVYYWDEPNNKVVCIKNNCKIVTDNHNNIIMITFLYEPDYIKKYFILCDNEEEYNYYSTKYVLFLLKN